MTDEFDYSESNNYNESSEEDDVRVSRYNTKRRMKQKKMQRKIKKTQRKIKNFRVVLRLIIIVVLIFIGYKALKLHQWYLNPSTFNSTENSSLEILNNKIVPSYKILSALRRTPVPTVPIYMAKMDNIKSSIMKLEPIDDVIIRRFGFPARLQVIVMEKIPVITIAPAPNVMPIAFFAKDGKLIGRDYMPLNKAFKTTLVLSNGFGINNYRHWDINKIKEIEKLSEAVEANAKEPVEYIDYRNPKDLYVKVKTANIRIGEYDETVFSRISRIPSILPQVKTLNKKIKYIDIKLAE